MGSFLKKFGHGLLYLLVLPIFLLILVGYSVYGLLIFLVVFVRSTIDFFKGKNFFRDLPEDIEAKKRLEMISNPFANMSEKKNDTVVVMEAGETTTPVVEIASSPAPEEIENKQNEYQYIESKPAETSNILIESKENENDEIDEDCSLEEEHASEDVVSYESNDDEIMMEDDEKDDHIF